MPTQKRLATTRQRRTHRVRNGLRRSAAGKPRLTVFRSNKHTYAQVVDDVAGRTLAAASTVDPSIAGPGRAAGDVDSAQRVGRLIAERAKAAGVEAVVFDRGRYAFHGRVAAVASAAREGGLQF